MLGGKDSLPFHANQLQVPAKVARVQPRDGQSVTEPSHRGLEIALVKVGVEARCLVYGGVHVRPDQGDGRSRDAASLIGNLDCDVFLALGDDDLCDGEVVLVLAMALYDSTQGVFQGLEEHVRQVARYVHEADVVVADELDLGGVEQTVVVLAYEARVLDGFLGEFADVGLCADDADVVGVGARALVGEGDVLADEHTDADTRHVEAVEEGLYVVVNLHPLSLALPLEDALGDGCHDAVVPPLDLLQRVCKLCVVCAQLWRPFLAVVCGSKVSPARRCAPVLFAVGIAVAVLWRRAVLALLYAGVLRCLEQRRGTLRGLQEPIFDVAGQGRPGKLDELLEGRESSFEQARRPDIPRTTAHTSRALCISRASR